MAVAYIADIACRGFNCLKFNLEIIILRWLMVFNMIDNSIENAIK